MSIAVGIWMDPKPGLEDRSGKNRCEDQFLGLWKLSFREAMDSIE